MFNLFKKRSEKPVLPAGKMMSRDDIISFLKTSPEKFLEFEEFYKTEILPHDVPSDADTFLLNAKQAAAEFSKTYIEDDYEDEPDVKIVRTKKFGVKPMNPEACVQMELLQHNFYVFLNSETDEVNVVYKRKNNTYGLIEPELD